MYIACYYVLSASQHGVVSPDTIDVSGQVTFQPGTSQASVMFTVVDDKEPQPLQCYCVELVKPDGLYLYLEQPKSTICVRDNEGKDRKSKVMKYVIDYMLAYLKWGIPRALLMCCVM